MNAVHHTHYQTCQRPVLGYAALTPPHLTHRSLSVLVAHVEHAHHRREATLTLAQYRPGLIAEFERQDEERDGLRIIFDSIQICI